MVNQAFWFIYNLLKINTFPVSSNFPQLWDNGMVASGSEILRLGENDGILGFSKDIIYL